MFLDNVEATISKAGKWLLIKRSFKEEHEGGTPSLSWGGGEVGKEGDSSDILERTLESEIFEEVGLKT
ncbi:hypothetical protein [Bacillus sp. 2205SS5-2]|uniref:hypothetical protein n=1 Tax=Bacillus sp. 2205SS5-2 TaxID=3109031 RepID=UPI003FA5B3BB